jgi:membrane carboxypeptidase/penicillin-binding protein
MASVWFGFDRPQRILSGAAAGRFATPVFGRLMRGVYHGEQPRLPKPQEPVAPAGAQPDRGAPPEVGRVYMAARRRGPVLRLRCILRDHGSAIER